ncbi:hypothetical protein IB274_29530, partial [Pseudomonas sp. PDM18]|uniref:hypothetical protein n=1 Tax=Pseudomonas sp. PDM18 TaxID=2769253 RepID=UPI001780E567
PFLAQLAESPRQVGDLALLALIHFLQLLAEAGRTEYAPQPLSDISLALTERRQRLLVSLAGGTEDRADGAAAKDTAITAAKAEE